MDVSFLFLFCNTIGGVSGFCVLALSGPANITAYGWWKTTSKFLLSNSLLKLVPKEYSMFSCLSGHELFFHLQETELYSLSWAGFMCCNPASIHPLPFFL